MYDIGDFIVEQKSFNDGIVDANCGLMYVFKNFACIGEAILMCVRGYECKKSALSKAIMLKSTSNDLSMSLLYILQVLAFLQ